MNINSGEGSHTLKLAFGTTFKLFFWVFIFLFQCFNNWSSQRLLPGRMLPFSFQLWLYLSCQKKLDLLQLEQMFSSLQRMSHLSKRVFEIKIFIYLRLHLARVHLLCIKFCFFKKLFSSYFSFRHSSRVSPFAIFQHSGTKCRLLISH